MESLRAGFEVVIGLEIHVQLATPRKLFAPEAQGSSMLPNSHVSAVTWAHPGALPALHLEALEAAVLLGLSTGGSIPAQVEFDRKNYFYPDLPKGYQMTQDRHPVSKGGHIAFPRPDLSVGRIRLRHIHLEEDAGKSLHDRGEMHSSIDLNRAGAALVEMVSEPDLRSAEDAAWLLAEVRRRVRQLGISDGNMEAGNLRCDANVSVRRLGDPAFGERVEIKNLNSFASLTKAIDYEADRQIGLMRNGYAIARATASWDPQQGVTLIQRVKESAEDYRYFPEPDLPPWPVPAGLIERLRQQIGPQPCERWQYFVQEAGLAHNEALLMAESPLLCAFLEQLAPGPEELRPFALWLAGPLRSLLEAREASHIPILPSQFRAFFALVQAGALTHQAAREQLLPACWEQPGAEPAQLAQAMGLLVERDVSEWERMAEALIAEFPEEVKRYRQGKKALLSFFTGQAMRRLSGKAQAQELQALLKTRLDLPE